jgi:hypothetical protein
LAIVCISVIGGVLYSLIVHAPQWEKSLLSAALPFRFHPRIVSPTPIPWNTYIDSAQGFSFQYPSNWHDENGQGARGGGFYPEQPGVSADQTVVNDCTNSTDYINKVVLAIRNDVKISPLPVTGFDGFVIEDTHLDGLTPGPEAYFIRCPAILRIGFNPTGCENPDQVFQQILTSVKMWQPQK